MPEENAVKKLTHRRIETEQTVIIEVNSLYQTAVLVFVLVTLYGFLQENNTILFLGIVLMLVQWVYSLINWNPVFREIKRAEAEKRLTTSGNKRSLNNPFTYTIQKGTRVVLNDTLND